MIHQRYSSKFIFLFLSIFIVLSVEGALNRAGADMSGDISDDDRVNLEDSILSLKVSARSSPGSLNTEADVDQDSKIGFSEAVYPLQLLSEIRALPSTLLASATISKKGGLLQVENKDSELAGASLKIQGDALPEDVTISIAVMDSVLNDSLYGQRPVGKFFVLGPEGLQFETESTLSLPVPADARETDLYIGSWDKETRTWENLGGERNGDYISVNISHLSTYGIFYQGKSFVRFVNNAADPPADLGIRLTYIAGPTVPPDISAENPFPAYRPLPRGFVDLKQGRASSMALLPGRYHFEVSYPHPQPGVANGLFFTIPVLTDGADDAGVDQVITITLAGATSTDSFTNASIDFSGAQVSPGTNLKPVIAGTAIAPEGVQVVSSLLLSPGLPSRKVSVGPIKIEQFTPSALKLTATAVDPEGASPLQFFWRQSGKVFPTFEQAESGDPVEQYFFPEPLRSGLYTVYLTVYDEFGLFDEVRWDIIVEPNIPPALLVVVDDAVIDFGRLDALREKVLTLPPLAPDIPQVFGNLCSYEDILPDPENIREMTLLRAQPSDDPDHINPSQYPDGMTCAYLITADADGDPVTAAYRLLTPLFGQGNMYAAITALPTAPSGADLFLPDGRRVATVFPGGIGMGDLIDTYDKMDAYNVSLSAMANEGLLPVQTLSPLVRQPLPPGVLHIGDPDDYYLMGFNQGSHAIKVGDVITQTGGATGKVNRMNVEKGSWSEGTASGYLWLIEVTSGPFQLPPAEEDVTLYVGQEIVAAPSSLGQALPIIWEAPDDPDAGQATHDRRHTQPGVVPAGGLIQLEGRVTDGFSQEKRAFDEIEYPREREVYPLVFFGEGSYSHIWNVYNKTQMNHRCDSVVRYKVEITQTIVSVYFYNNMNMSIDFEGSRYCREDYPDHCWDVKCEISEPDDYTTGAGWGTHEDHKYSTQSQFTTGTGAITGRFDNFHVSGQGQTYERYGLDNVITFTEIFNFDIKR